MATAAKRIAQSDAGVREAAGIDHDGIRAIRFGGLNAIDQRTLVIALEAYHAGTGIVGLRYCRLLDFGQRSGSVDRGLACSKQIQVRAIQQQYVFCHGDGAPFDDNGRILPLNGADWQGKIS